MSVVLCAVMPHPPVAVPEVGGSDAEVVERTQNAMMEVGRRIAQCGAQTCVIISPHAPVFQEIVGVNENPKLYGDLSRFLASGVRVEAENDLELAEEIKEKAAALGLDAIGLDDRAGRRFGVSTELDHGVTVPLYFLQKAGVRLPLVCVSMMFAPPPRLYLFGVAVQRAAVALGRKVALIASGDLSHRLTPGAPAGYSPRGAEFDRELARLLSVPDAAAVMQMDPGLVEEAGECGYRSIVMMLGALDGREVEAEVLSYEGPFGVGYLTASFKPLGENPARSLLKELEEKKRAETQKRREKESFLVRLARETLERKVKGLPPPQIGEVPEEFRGRAGVFVSIKKHGTLRGCIGTIEPTRGSIVEEVMANALSAGLNDPRFWPVGEEELDDLEYSVDVLEPPEPVAGLHELDPKKYGVIVSSGWRKGLLLPDLEGVQTAEEQVEIARRKAGIPPGEPVRLERFKVVRYK